MTPSIRLALVALLIVGSAVYSLLVVSDPTLASAVASGYVALVLSIFTIVNVWKKHL
jgi:hypothetical protein